MPVNINRIDCDRKYMHGFQVRLAREHTKYFSKFYADHKFGGTYNALTLACITLQEKYDEGYPMPQVASLAGHDRQVNTNIVPRRKGGAPSLYWQISLPLSCGKRQSVRFYVNTQPRLDLIKAKHQYRIAHGVQAYQKDLAVENGTSEHFPYLKYDLDHLAALYPINTDFITMDYLHTLFDDWSLKNAC